METTEEPRRSKYDPINDPITKALHRAYRRMLEEKALHGWNVVIVRDGRIQHIPAAQLLAELDARAQNA